jgi:2-oxoglutarate ferredoxin oxidoreductase subunit alpha
MKLNIVFGGKAGQGPNILADVVCEGLINSGFYAFNSRDYQSLIRGGHNFNHVTFSDNPVYSNSSKIDILVCLDEKTEEIHKKSLNKKAIIMEGVEHNMFFAGALFKLLGLDLRLIENSLRKLRRFDENIKEAKQGYYAEKRSLNIGQSRNNLCQTRFMNGNQGISSGAIKSGLDYYYSYPMTPATPVMMELAQLSKDKNAKHKVIELENEIAVMISALGSSIVGARSMVGTSGGGFDLMTEGLSMAGQAEIPIVIYLSSRPGPSTGLATYSGQGDLNLALYSGHGEFSRVVITPGDALESIESTNQAFYLSQKFRVPAFVYGDKHLAESKSVVQESEKILEITNSITKPQKFNSYEHDANGIATESAEITKKNFDRKGKKYQELVKEASKFVQYKIHGSKTSKNIVIGWGSTKGAILDAINDGKLDAKFLQIIYMKPFPAKQVAEEIKKAKKVLIVENNATAQLADLITRKTGFFIDDKNKILRYDGRPFLSDELGEELKRRIK